MKTRLLLVLVLYVQQTDVPPRVTPPDLRKTLSICEVLGNLQILRGKIIEVRGRWSGSSLEATGCAQLRTGDYTWKSSISIEMPSSPILELEKRPATWILDEKTYFEAEQQLLVQANQHNRFVIATLVGRLDARENLQIVRGDDGTVFGLGFGETGLYPAQLVLATIKDVVPEGK